MISACRTGEQWRTALGHLESLKEEAVNANSFIMNAAIASCVRCGKWKKAGLLFEATLASGVQPDAITYNTALTIADTSLWGDGVVLLRNMAAAALKRDLFSYNTALSSCEKEGSWQHAQHLVDVLGHLAIASDTITANSLLSMYAGCSRWDSATSTLSRMSCASLQSDIISHSSALSACSGKRWALSGFLLHRIRDAQIRTNVLTFNTAISIFEGGLLPESYDVHKRGAWQLALEMFAKMQVQRDVITYNACITTAKPRNGWHLASLLLQHASQAGIRPNVRTHNVAVATLDIEGLWQAGIWHLGSMRSGSTQPDVITYSSIQSSCAQSLQWLLGIRLLLETPGLQESVVFYGTAVGSCAVEGQWKNAVRIASIMVRRAVVPNAVICNSVISACEKGCQWIQAIGSLAGIFANSVETDLSSPGKQLKEDIS